MSRWAEAQEASGRGLPASWMTVSTPSKAVDPALVPEGEVGHLHGRFAAVDAIEQAKLVAAPGLEVRPELFSDRARRTRDQDGARHLR